MSVGSTPQITVLGPEPAPRFLDEAIVHDVDGQTAATILRAPELFLTGLIHSLRKGPRLSAHALNACLEEAADIFETKSVGGLLPSEFTRLVGQVGGLPEAVIGRSVQEIAHALRQASETAQLGIPRGAAIDPEEEQCRGGTGRSRRRGDVVSVIAPGNGPGPHALWPQAVALGYRVVIRPSEREPFTAQRLVSSMQAAGLQDYVVLAPCTHQSVPALIRESDLSIVYGSDATVERYRNSPNVLVQGPGRSKVVITADQVSDAAISLAFDSVAALGGAACVCASAILVEGDHVAFARSLADYAEHRFRDPEYQASAVPRLSAGTAKWLRQRVEDDTTLIRRPSVDELAEGGFRSAALVRCVETAYHPLVQQELPVAAVTVAPFDRAKDMSAIAPALVLTLLTSDVPLIEQVEQLPDIRNLYVGPTPTTWMRPQVPHDGFLAEFLMTTTGYRRVTSEH